VARWYDEVFADRVRLGLRVERTLASRQSGLQHIEVIETAAFGRVLVIDGVFMTSEADEHYYHEMLVHPALSTAPRVARVLVIGGGDGGTARQVLRHAGVERVTMVEIDGAVIELCREHLPALGAWDDPRLDVIVGDGVAFARDAAAKSFDVVLLDGTDPVGPGEALFDAGFYRDVRRLLGDDGVFALQSASPFLMREVFDRVQRDLGGVFAQVHPYFGPAPIYASGVWSWTWASDGGDPQALDLARAAAVEPACRYWNRDIHRAAFAVPSELRR
jgi:spermidine synthase